MNLFIKNQILCSTVGAELYELQLSCLPPHSSILPEIVPLWVLWTPRTIMRAQVGTAVRGGSVKICSPPPASVSCKQRGMSGSQPKFLQLSRSFGTKKAKHQQGILEPTITLQNSQLALQDLSVGYMLNLTKNWGGGVRVYGYIWLMIEKPQEDI